LVTYAVTPEAVARQRGSEAAAFDWRLTTLLTMAKSDGTMEDVDNPRWLKNKLEQIKALSRAVSAEETVIRDALGLAAIAPIPFSQRTGKLNRLRRQISVIHRKASRQRKDFYHKLTALLVSRFAFLGTEALAVDTMTRSPKAKPDPETPGQFLANGAAQKAGLNRRILDAAPSMLIGMLRTKAVEAASVFAEANTRPLKPTQRCHACGEIVKKALSERRHVCACGTDCGRDENAAKTILRWLLEGNDWLGTNPREGASRFSETLSIA
jgi:putative transposase